MTRLSLFVGNKTVSETDGSATFTVTLDRTPAEDVTVVYVTSDGTTTENGDYTAQSATLTISAGETSGTISVPILTDTEFEVNRNGHTDLEYAQPTER